MSGYVRLGQVRLCQFTLEGRDVELDNFWKFVAQFWGRFIIFHPCNGADLFLIWRITTPEKFTIFFFLNEYFPKHLMLFSHHLNSDKVWHKNSEGSYLTIEDDVITNSNVDNVFWNNNKFRSRVHRQMVPGSILKICINKLYNWDHLFLIGAKKGK